MLVSTPRGGGEGGEGGEEGEEEGKGGGEGKGEGETDMAVSLLWLRGASGEMMYGGLGLRD